MQSIVLEQIAGGWCIGSSDFPFEFCCEARSGPAGVGVGFVEADVADGFARIYNMLAIQGEVEPLAVALFPVQRGAPGVRGDSVPTVGEP